MNTFNTWKRVTAVKRAEVLLVSNMPSYPCTIDIRSLGPTDRPKCPLAIIKFEIAFGLGKLKLGECFGPCSKLLWARSNIGSGE